MLVIASLCLALLALLAGLAPYISKRVSLVPALISGAIWVVAWLDERHAVNGEPGLVGGVGLLLTAVVAGAALVGWLFRPVPRGGEEEPLPPPPANHTT